MPAQLKILLRKNIKYEFRVWRQTLLEFLIIIIIFTIVVINPIERVADEELDEEDAGKTKFYRSDSLEDLKYFSKLLKLKTPIKFILAYTPEGEFTKKVTDGVKNALNLRGTKSYDTESRMEAEFDGNSMLAALVFTELQGDDVPEKLKIRIRYPSTFRTIDTTPVSKNLWITRCNGDLGDDDPFDEFKNTDLYIREGFLQLQHAIFSEWAKLLAEKEGVEYKEVTVEAQSFRQNSPETERCKLVGNSNIIMLLMDFTFFLPFLHVIRKFASEREENIFVHHWLYGYKFPTHWVAHFLISSLHFLLLDLLIFTIVKIPWNENASSGCLLEVNFLVLMLYLILYSSALIISAIALVSLFVTIRHSMLYGVVFWITSYAMFSPVLSYTVGQHFGLMFSFVAFFNNAFAYGLHYMRHIEEADDRSDIWILMGLIVINIFVHLFFLSVIQYFSPGRYIRRQRFDFLGICTYCCNEKIRKPQVTMLDRSPSWHHFEHGPVDGDEYIFVKNICANFGNRNPTLHYLKNISMHIYKNEITVILGPHSSGKTSLICLLAGWKLPDAGSVKLFNKDIHQDWETSRQYIDVCMPNNVLFDNLTVVETLDYFISIKLQEVDPDQLRIQREKWLEILRPSILHKNLMVKRLSFEQKRLLFLCCALSCKKKAIFLDEPTLHMRVKEQRLYWNILQQEKAGRAIVLTTISIDEAEAVGDRIGILNEGVLQTYGTPYFLKTKYGVGCDLIILKSTYTPSAPITELISTFMPHIMPENEIGDQLIYKMPADSRPNFQRLLLRLENESENLGIENIRVVSSDLGEIYMTLGMRRNNQIVSDYTKAIRNLNKDTKPLVKNQICAMFYKKLIYQAPNVIPVIMFFVAILLVILLGQISKVLKVPPKRESPINLGFNKGETTRRALTRFINCKFVEIGSLDEGNQRLVKSGIIRSSLTFTDKSLKCEKYTGFQRYMKTTKSVHDKWGAVEYRGNAYICWINEHNFHSAALALNLAHNIILNQQFPDNLNIIAIITNQPMPIPLQTKVNLLDNELMHLVVPGTIGIILPFIISCFILPLVEERIYHVKLLQQMAGLRPEIYWFVHFVWDFCTYILYTIIIMISMALTTIEGFGLYAKLTTCLLLNIYGIPALGMTYLISMLYYPTKLAAFGMSVTAHLLTGIFAYIFYWDITENSSLFFNIASLFPTFALLDGISNIYTEAVEEESCAESCKHMTDCTEETMCHFEPQCCFDTFFKWQDPGVNFSILFMIISAIIFTFLIFCVGVCRKERKYHTSANLKKLRSAAYSYDDSDVVTIKKRIARATMGDCRSMRIVVDQLENIIPKKGKDLHTISFALDKVVCMGIYGSHHSGKTHLVRQLVGQDGFQFGDVYIAGKELKYELREAHSYIGYCPQDHGLFPTFTPREMLRLFCMIRGVADKVIPEVLKDLANNLDMRKFMGKKIQTLSPDKRRKVNIAIALVGYTDLIILDEPTSGMPALTRREIWNVLRYTRFCGKTIIFTSSDNIECEALADHIILFEDGEMYAIGSTQYMRLRNTKGFYLELKLQRDGATPEEANEILQKDIENLHRFVTFLHEDSELLWRIDNLLKFYVPVPTITFSALYGSLEKNKRRLNIVDYTVSQGTMSDVMQNIAAKRKHRKILPTK